MKTSGIILIAGSSTRYNKGMNKNLELINNIPVFMYSIRVMNKVERINEIILVIKPEDEEQIIEYLKQEKIDKPIRIVYGGTTRKESVYNALLESNNDIVVIHDGARPLIKKEYIEECQDSLEDYSGAIVGVPVKDTIKIINDNSEIVESTNRQYTWIAQTPQCFRKKVLLELHEKYKDDKSITDDSILLEKEKIKVKMIRGSYTNIKLTTKEDLTYIKELLN